MAEISSELVKELRKKTGAGIMDCKRALVEEKGDIENAIRYMREKGLLFAEKKLSRETSDGIISSYIHAGGKIGVMVEVNCETDFVAKTHDFLNLTKDIAMHAAAMSPRYVKREDVPPELVEKEKAIYREQAKHEGKPGNIIEKIIEGRLEKFYKEVCLLEQPFVKDPDITVAGLVANLISKLGENIRVRRFVRYKVGEEI